MIDDQLMIGLLQFPEQSKISGRKPRQVVW